MFMMRDDAKLVVVVRRDASYGTQQVCTSCSCSLQPCG